jgi:RNA polymerase sigma-70 factor, ECF subfamily
MGQEVPGSLTALIGEARAGDQRARDRLVGAVYGEFHRIAEGLMRRERPGHTLQPSALVNEAVVRLLDSDALAQAPHRRYLLTAAAQAMRQVLVDHARKRDARKRAGGGQRVPLDDVLAHCAGQNPDVLDLDEALERLMALDQRKGLVVILRYFAGLSVAEVAEVLDVSAATVEGDWRSARAWLRAEVGGSVE